MVPRILHIYGQMDRGGAESRIMDLYRALDRNRAQFDFVVTKPGRHHFFDEIESLGGHVHYIDPPAICGFIGHARQLARVIRTHGPFQAVHAATLFNGGIAMTVARLCGVRHRIAHARNASSPKSGIKFRLYSTVMRQLILHNATDLLMCSTPAGEFLFGKKAVADGKVVFLPNAVDLSRFGKIPGHNLRAELDLAAETTVLGTVANLRPQKNQGFLLAIFGNFVEAHPDAALVIAGEGPLRPVLEEQARQLQLTDKIFFLGNRPDIPDVLAAFDIFLLPSLYEGLPGSVIEAQAAGLPCLLADTITPEVAVCSDMVQFCSLKRGAAAWAQKIGQMLQQPRRTVRECKDMLSAAGYDPSASLHTLMRIYGIA